MSTNVIIEDIRLTGGLSSMPVVIDNLFYQDSVHGVAVTKGKLVNSSQYNSSSFYNDGSAATVSVKNSEVAVDLIQVVNTGATAVYICLMNLAAAPTTTVTAIDTSRGDRVFYLPGNSTLSISSKDFAAGQMFFSEGCQLAISTNAATYTAYGTPAELKTTISHN